MDKMTDSRAVEVLSEMREGDVLIDEADYVAAIDHAIARLREPAEAQPTPIGDLLADYEANGCDFTDLAWVRAAARGYVKTMPDSQVRCLLHVLAQTTAEAQSGGEVEPDGYTSYGEFRWACDCDERQQREWTPVYLAPPSAPVGVEDADLVARLDAIHQRVFGKPYPTEALAQQPAAVDGEDK